MRKHKWRDKQGRQHEKWMVHIEHTWPNGRKQAIPKVSPVQTKRGAEQYERELRLQLGFTSPKSDQTRELPLTWDASETLHVQRSRAAGELVFPRGSPLPSKTPPQAP